MGFQVHLQEYQDADATPNDGPLKFVGDCTG